MKLLGRLGTDAHNTIIIDRAQANFRHDAEMGVELPWTGKRRDSKLLNFLETLTLIFQEVLPPLSRKPPSRRASPESNWPPSSPPPSGLPESSGRTKASSDVLVG